MNVSASKSSESGSRSQRSSCVRSCGALRRMVLFDQVAHAADGPQLHPRGLELAAQAVDEHLDRVAARLVVPAIEMFGDLLLGDHPALAHEQELEHRQLARREL